MGCCGNHNKSFLEFSTDDIKDMNDLEQEVNYIVTNKNNIFKNDNQKIILLINKVISKNNELEEKLNKIQNNTLEEKSKNNLIEQITQEIQKMKNFTKMLNDIKNELGGGGEEDTQQIDDILSDDLCQTNRENLFKNKKFVKGSNSKEKIYFKKNIKMNKKRNKICITKKKYVNDEDNSYIINIIFILEDGQKIGIQIDKREQFLKAIEKLGEKEEGYDKIDNIFVFDGENEITDDIKEGKIIQDFGFNDYHCLQIKFFSNID